MFALCTGVFDLDDEGVRLGYVLRSDGRIRAKEITHLCQTTDKLIDDWTVLPFVTSVCEMQTEIDDVKIANMNLKL